MADLNTLLQLIDETDLTAADAEQLIARLRRKQHPDTKPAHRVPGLTPGIWMSDDFDAELPDEFWGFDTSDDR